MRKKRVRSTIGKLIVCISIIWLSVISMVGCLGKEFDAGAYVSSMMDAYFHGDYEEFAKITNSTVEEIQKIVEKDNEELNQQTFVGDNISEEDKQAYKLAIIKAYKLARYKVKDVKKDENKNYVVTMSLWPSSALKITEEQVQSKIEARMQETGEDFDMLEIASLATTCINESIDTNTYDVATTYKVHVVRDDNGIYAIPDDEKGAIYDILFPEE